MLLILLVIANIHMHAKPYCCSPFQMERTVARGLFINLMLIIMDYCKKVLLDLLVIGGIHGFLTLFGKYCSCKCNSWEHLVNFFKGAGLTIKIMTMAMV